MAGYLPTQNELIAFAEGFYADEAMLEDVDPLYDHPEELSEEDAFNALNDPLNADALADLYSAPPSPVYSDESHWPHPDWLDQGTWMCDDRFDPASEPRRVKCDASSSDKFE